MENWAYAKTACDELILNGYSDWHLPSKEELNALHVNLTQIGVGGFAVCGYWSSTEYDDYDAWLKYFPQNYLGEFFYRGQELNMSKKEKSMVRAVRAF
jgi:hypothetical protein